MVLVGMVLLPAAAWAQAKVAVIDTVQASLKLKLGLRQAVATALDDLSVAMVPFEDLLPEDADCTDASCYTAMAKRVQATHLLLVQGVANPAGYRLALDVRDGETGRSLGSDGKDCELCAEKQFSSTVQERVTALWIRVMQEQTAPRPAETTPSPSPSPQPMAPVVEQSLESEVPSFWQQRTPVLGLGFGVLGLVAVGFGVYYIAVDGDTVHLSKSNLKPIILRDTAKWGWGLVGVGAVSLIAGSAMVIWGRDDGSNVSVAVGPRSIGLQGRF
jgi:hypothetical protein